MAKKAKMKVRPLADRILVKREEPSETVRGGIIIPDTAKEKPQEGKVVAAGPGKLDTLNHAVVAGRRGQDVIHTTSHNRSCRDIVGGS